MKTFRRFCRLVCLFSPIASQWSDWHEWPALPELFPTSFPGSQDQARPVPVVDIDLDRLKERVSRTTSIKSCKS